MAAAKVRSQRRCIAHLATWGTLSALLVVATGFAFAGRWRWGTKGNSWAGVVQLGERGLASVGCVDLPSDAAAGTTVRFTSPETMTMSASSSSGVTSGDDVHFGFRSFSSFSFTSSGPINYGLDRAPAWRPAAGEETVNSLASLQVRGTMTLSGVSGVIGQGGGAGALPTPRPPFGLRLRHASVPLWMPLAFTAAMTGLWGARLRRAVRHGPGTCAACGYDLRATPERCPECGAVPA